MFGIDGQIRQASSMTYNSKSIAGMFVYSPATANGNTYYAYSRAEFYNGNGYTTFTGYKYPVLKHPFIKNMNTTDTPTAIKNLMAKTEYEVNDNGETYGSALSAYTIGAEPDLISAVGTNGVEGYVRADDLTPKVSSIEEALEQNAENGDVRTIPLYAEDGETVLGEFELVTNIEYDIDTN
ncbi:hypothetical protein [Brevibacillus panacihumi]|uniref:hypothetical protein n=1 Tax=Brevibacillus panacihumi TaxID=497735 RepID=UPI003D247E99